MSLPSFSLSARRTSGRSWWLPISWGIMPSLSYITVPFLPMTVRRSSFGSNNFTFLSSSTAVVLFSPFVSISPATRSA